MVHFIFDPGHWKMNTMKKTVLIHRIYLLQCNPGPKQNKIKSLVSD